MDGKEAFPPIEESGSLVLIKSGFATGSVCRYLLKKSEYY
jgi:hypothetical protein